jgi:hypothetical protein
MIAPIDLQDGNLLREKFLDLRKDFDGTTSLLCAVDTIFTAIGRSPLNSTTGPDLEIGIIYVKYVRSKTEDATAFDQAIADAICAPGQKHKDHADELSKILYFSDLTSGALTAVISDLKPLVLPDCQND